MLILLILSKILFSIIDIHRNNSTYLLDTQ